MTNMQSMQEELPQIEAACNALYTGQTSEMKNAHDALLPLVSNPANVAQLKFIIENSSQQNALVFSALGLHKLITSNWSQVPQAQRDGLKAFLLQYLATKGEALLKFAPGAMSPMIRLFVRIENSLG